MIEQICFILFNYFFGFNSRVVLVWDCPGWQSEMVLQLAFPCMKISFAGNIGKGHKPASA
jgi:hypothetical protein